MVLLTMVPVILIFNPVINLYLPAMKNVKRWRNADEKRFMESVLLKKVGNLNCRPGAPWIIACIFFVLALVAFYLNMGLQVGDIQEGTPILIRSHPSTTRMWNRHGGAPSRQHEPHAGGGGRQGRRRQLKQPELLNLVDQFKAHISKIPDSNLHRFHRPFAGPDRESTLPSGKTTPIILDVCPTAPEGFTPTFTC